MGITWTYANIHTNVCFSNSTELPDAELLKVCGTLNWICLHKPESSVSLYEKYSGAQRIKN